MNTGQKTCYKAECKQLRDQAYLCPPDKVKGASRHKCGSARFEESFYNGQGNDVLGGGDSGRGAEDDIEGGIPAISLGGPYFDTSASKNVTALVGKTAYLNCRVKNLGNRTQLNTA
ncbi:hypothetical protein J437_LFUL004942 [Ladona fulva]|uniref:Uncharacterized protein n=1 Tax=Ladona fulva TaxID=123851 RepID=A0A8K0KND5_LADFU|nr:hypothetical protein J437_LFUL004942 [Ladona fulva]